MPNLYPKAQCEACQFPPRAEDQVVAHLLERISELEDENDNLRKLEATILRNSHLFDVLLRASQEGILLLSPDLTILRLIHSALGYSEKDLLGESVLALIHSSDAPLLEKCCSNLLSGHGEPPPVEIRTLSPDGKWIWLAAHVTDMLDDPMVQAIVLNARRLDKPSEPVRPAVR